MYTTEELIRLRDSGNYPIANLKIFDSINKIKLSDRVLDNIKYTEEVYLERIEMIDHLDNKNDFLESIKLMEARDNQDMEREDLFIFDVLSHYYKDNCIDYLLTHDFNKESFIEAHKILLEGTSTQEYANNDYRNNNDTYISQEDYNGSITPYYFALDYKDIPEAIDRLLEYYASNDDTNIFQKGIITHGLIAALQMFNDGNTRYGRVLQYLKIKDLTEKLYQKQLDQPYLYGTKAYYPMKENYRELMSNLAINPDNESWNAWINFNLNRLQDRMNYEEERIEQAETRKKISKSLSLTK